MALVTSVAATGVVAGAMAFAERSDQVAGYGTIGADSSAGQSPPTDEVTPIVTTAAATAEPSPALTETTAAAREIEAPDATDGPTTTVEVGRYTDGVWVGTAESTEWGDVQVQVTVSGGDIVDVDALQVPDDRKSSSINDRAVPTLEAQAIAIQGADLDIVSGATYTSRTYASSLQAALDEAAPAAHAATG